MKRSTQPIFSPRISLAPLVGILVVARSACGQIASAQQPAAASSPLGAPTARATATLPPAPAAGPPTIAESSRVEIELSGIVEQIASSWRISGTSVEVNGETEIRGATSIGDTVEVHPLRFSDGRLVARRIEILDGGDDNGSQ